MNNDTKYPLSSEATRLKSKAQQYVDIINNTLPPKFIFKGKVYAFVHKDGGSTLVGGDYSQEFLLALRDWLTDTFDVPKIPGRQPGWSRED